MEESLQIAEKDSLGYILMPAHAYHDLIAPNQSLSFGDADGQCITFTYKGVPAIKTQFGITKILINCDLLAGQFKDVYIDANKFTAFMAYVIDNGVSSQIAFELETLIKNRDDPLWDRLLVTGKDFSAALIVPVSMEEMCEMMPVIAPVANLMEVCLSIKPEDDDQSIATHVARLRALKLGESTIGTMFAEGWKNAKMVVVGGKK